jgi:hypothetical protein
MPPTVDVLNATRCMYAQYQQHTFLSLNMSSSAIAALAVFTTRYLPNSANQMFDSETVGDAYKQQVHQLKVCRPIIVVCPMQNARAVPER